MNRLNAILLALVVFCAWSVVTSQYVARKLYGDMQKEQKAAKQLAVEYGQLQLEQSTWGAHAVIEKAASSRLGMHVPDPRQIQVISAKGGA
ncbi:MAG TPA: cell division protein FtsL [Chromobacteriaceae bacterium]|nr:cell division protein FtsL [Chromobacteriaceae bacterium]